MSDRPDGDAQGEECGETDTMHARPRSSKLLHSGPPTKPIVAESQSFAQCDNGATGFGVLRNHLALLVVSTGMLEQDLRH
jgi:hypothetical protein